MIRKIVKIDEEKCNGCGLCAKACHEGAIGMIDGKAKLLRDDYCDGLGDCLPVCPTKAISFEEREALAYDEKAVMENQRKQRENVCACKGSQPKKLEIREETEDKPSVNVSRLSQWPVQIKLAPINAEYFNGAKLLIAADCTAFAYGNFHNDFIKDHIVLVGCPKLDSVDYSEKIKAIIMNNDIKSVSVVRMEVPCCGGIENAVKRAIMESGKFIPWQITTISTNGQIIDRV